MIALISLHHDCHICVNPLKSFQTTFEDLQAAMPSTDVLYVTRIQKERFPSPEAYDQVCACCNYLCTVLERAVTFL